MSAAAVACGTTDHGGQQGTSPPGVASGDASTVRTTVYFLVDEGHASIGVRRTVEPVPPAQGSRVRAALAALLEGPLPAEEEVGLTTALPADVRLESLSFRGRGGMEAVIQLSGLPPVHEAPVLLKVRVITQVARTVIGVSSIQRIWLRADGKPWDLIDMEGRVVDRPTDYERLLGFWIGTAEAGTGTVVGDYFKALP